MARLLWVPSAATVLFLGAAAAPITLRGRWGAELSVTVSTIILLILAALAARHAMQVHRLARQDPPEHAVAVLRLRMLPLDLATDRAAWDRVRRVEVLATRSMEDHQDWTSRAIDHLFDWYYERLGLGPVVRLIYDDGIEGAIPKVYEGEPEELVSWIRQRMSRKPDPPR